MQIAFCISGQIRDEEASLARIAVIARQMQATVFISTWERPGTKTAGAMNPPQLARMFGPDFVALFPAAFLGPGNLPRIFPTLAARIEHSTRGKGPVTQAALETFFPGAEFDIEAVDRFASDFASRGITGNELRMLYKIWRCNEMKRNHEHRAGARFDIVVRLRPDMPPQLTPQHVLQAIRDEPGRISVRFDGADGVDDCEAVMTSAAADHYAALLGKALQAPTRPWGTIHFELRDHLLSAGHRIVADLGGGDVPALHRQRLNRDLLNAIPDAECQPDGLLTPANFDRLRQTLRLFDQDLHRMDASGMDRIRLEIEAHPCDPGVMAAYCMALTGALLRAGHATLAREAGLLAWVHLHRAAEPAREDAAVGTTLDLLRTDEIAALMGVPGARLGRPGTRVRSVLAALRGGELAGMLRTLRASLSRPAGIEALKRKAWHRLFQQGDVESVVRLAEAVVKQAPADPAGHDMLSHCHEQQGAYPLALHHARAAWACHPTNGGLSCRLGVLLSRHFGAHAEAEPILAAAVADWNAAQPWAAYAEALFHNGKAREAEAAARHAVGLAPDDMALRSSLEKALSEAPRRTA